MSDPSPDEAPSLTRELALQLERAMERLGHVLTIAEGQQKIIRHLEQRLCDKDDAMRWLEERIRVNYDPLPQPLWRALTEVDANLAHVELEFLERPTPVKRPKEEN